MKSKSAAGENTVCYCTKCKMDLSHTIVAMIEDKIVRVKCRTCGSEHNYRDRTKKRATIKKGTSTAKRATPVKSPERRWEEAVFKAKGQDIPYEMSGSYNKGDIVLHVSFGRGVVLEVFEKKVTIIFEDKERVLAASY
ncbi:MAG: hypothetical protein IMF07_00105 [Proteobacteria bacterium]|nr:hypothetical protein [Pseudomonadota bacterium]